MSRQNYDIKTLQDYLAGKLDPMAMHALERQALEDPLLAEALEGLAANPQWGSEDLEGGMDRLYARLDSRVAAGAATSDLFLAPEDKKDLTDLQSTTPVEPLNREGDKRKWWGVAAIVLVLLAGGWFYFASQGIDRATDSLQPNPEIASAVTKALIDSNKSGSHMAKGNKAVYAAKGTEPEKQTKPLPADQTTETISAAGKKLSMGPEDKKPAALGSESLSLATHAPIAAAASLAADRLMASQPSFFKDSAAMETEGLNSNQRWASGNIPGISNMDGDSEKANNIARIYIRGRRPVLDSLLPGQKGGPLVVVDGNVVVGNPLDSIDPNNITHLDVLKEPVARALYGDLAENGVVLITTTKAIAAHSPNRDSQTAYLKRDKLPAGKKNILSNKSFSAQLNGKVPGLEVDAAPALAAALQVEVHRLSGSLQPMGGFKALERYLEKQWVVGFNNKIVRWQDTGIVKVEVRIGNEAYGHGIIVELNKEGHRTAFINWLNAVLARGPRWEQGQVDTLNSGDSSDGIPDTQRQNGPATIQIYFNRH
ncbi:TonB-dependent receptor plug domain-containing protein [Arachidicoccus terrestris]|uniref:TonB-dependent receptor plug domain-containing protein n=1 Tax=Arachidicoccus terrestris TaxID=2875539 RepID=UPI001CC53CAE|nr:TonB-dependent receptor plug domain-containing protein [Arachidicoccus terrestris]UAY56318.1 TonB-dependent receptor plug domain-containing protein [Arachidicoccus terrestris]